MEYLYQEWNPARRTWEPAGEEPARYPWRRVLADRPEPVPAAYRAPRRLPVPPESPESKGRQLAAWIHASKAPSVTVYAARNGVTPAMHRANQALCRELSRLGWSGEMRFADPADWQGPPVDLGPEAVTGEA